MLRKILAEMRAAAVVAFECRSADRAADCDEIFEVEPIHPGQVKAAIPVGDAAGGDRACEPIEPRCGVLQLRAAAQNADLIPHQFQQFFAHRKNIARRAADRPVGAIQRRIDRSRITVRQRPGLVRHGSRHPVASNRAKHRRIRDAVAAEPVCPMHAARVFAGRV